MSRLNRTNGMSRRSFLRAGGLAAGYSLANLAAAQRQNRDINCILLFLVGGPSHIDTWDPKPHAPDQIRGPFRPIQTTIPGMQVSELFPRMARMADRYAIVRSVYHDSAPIHETGQQLMQAGHLFRAEQEYPHYGAVVSRTRGPGRNGVPPFVILPGPIGNTGVSISHGQGAGNLGSRHEPVLVNAECRMQNAEYRCANSFCLLPLAFCIRSEKDEVQARFGRNPFGQSCLLARQLIEQGVRFVTVNMFDTVFNKVTWDCHAAGGSLNTTLRDYQNVVCPMFDLAYTALLEDLHQRGLLQSTMVLAMGEFGRTPRLNATGGRDHWPGVWSILFAGGKVRGGRVIGASDRIGAEPRDRPVNPAQVAASVYHGLDIDHAGLGLAEPASELFRS
jgi:hypothetical protein